MEEIKAPSIERTWHNLYIESQANPTDHRSDKQFCEDIALDYYAFSSWKHKYRPFIYREVEAIRKNYRNELRSRIYKALDKKLDSDTNAIKLLAQLMGDLVEKTEVKTENMNDQDKVRRIASLLKANTKKQREWDRAQATEAKESSPSNEVSGPDSQESGGSEPGTAS